MFKKIVIWTLGLLTVCSVRAAQVIHSSSGGEPKQVNILIDAKTAGNTATFMATASRHANVCVCRLRLTDPDGVVIAENAAESDDHNSDRKYSTTSVIVTVTLKPGVYVFREEGSGGGTEIGHLNAVTVVDWDQPGEDITRLEIDLKKIIEDLRKELLGESGSQTGTLKGQIDDLRKELNEAIANQNKSQQELLKRIEDYEKYIQTLISNLQQKLVDLEVEQADYLARLDNLRIIHDKDVLRLESVINNLDSKYKLETDRINSDISTLDSTVKSLEKRLNDTDRNLLENINKLQVKDMELKSQMETYRLLHERKMYELEVELGNLEKDLNGQISDRYEELKTEIDQWQNLFFREIDELNFRMAELENNLHQAVLELSQADREIIWQISELREKQAEHYAMLEALRQTHERDKAALQQEIKAVDDKYKQEVADINAHIEEIDTEIAKLQQQHERDVKEIQARIDSTLDQLDSEVRKIYLALKDTQDDLDSFKKLVIEKFEEAELRMELLDRAVNDRLKNLENRIKYAVYSDERLAQLVEEFKADIRERERDIADLELEIQEMKFLGLDTTAKETILKQRLEKLVSQRNELTDIEFAIKLRNDDSEFAVHEAEIEALKKALASLRDSTDLRIQQLQEQLAETERKMLELIERVQAEADEKNAELRNALEKFKEDVLIMHEIIRGEREAGDKEIKDLLAKMDAEHLLLMGQLDKDFKDAMEKLKFEQDIRFEELRSTINNLAMMQRNANSGGSYYGLPSGSSDEIPYDDRDMRVSPDVILEIGY